MRTLILERDKRPISAWRKKFAGPEHVDRVIRTTMRIETTDGELVAINLVGALSATTQAALYPLLSQVSDGMRNRSSACGTTQLPRIKRDGTLSPRKVVPKSVADLHAARGTASGILGYRGETLTKLSRQRKDMMAACELVAQRMSHLYRRMAPEHYNRQLPGPGPRLWGSPFSTIYVAKNFRTAYHTDGNLPGSFGIITPMGDYTGGELVFPRLRVALAMRPGDVVLFNTEEAHGNLRIFGERVSAIYYAQRQRK